MEPLLLIPARFTNPRTHFFLPSCW